MMSGQQGAIATARVWKYGDSVNTDVIFPGRYTYTIRTPEEAAPHALEDLDPEFAGTVRPGDVVVAGRNFGCGSSREQAATCLKQCGVAAIIAVSFGRIFYRNAINNGLPVVTCVEAVAGLHHGDRVELDLPGGTLRGETGEWSFIPLTGTVRSIVDAGGLIPYTERRLGGGRSTRAEGSRR